MQRLIKTFFLISVTCACLSLQLTAAELKTRTAASDMIDVEADRLDVNKAKGEAVFKGNVKAVQGNTIIKGAVLTLFIDNATKKVDKMIVEKNVYIKWEDKESTCDHAVYTIPEKKLELTGNAIITRGDEKVSGQKILIDMIKDHQVVESGKSGRVKMRVNSGSESGVLEWKK